MSIFSVGGNLGAAVSPLWVALWTASFGLQSALTILPVALVGAFLLQQQSGSLPLFARSPAAASSGSLERTVWVGVGLVVAAVIMRSWFQVALMTYLPVWVERTGGTLAQGGQLLSLFLFAIGGGSLLGGLLSDRIGSWRVLTGSMATLALAYWFFLHGGLQIQALTLLVAGVAVGCTYPTAILLAVDVLPGHAALASGLIMGWGWAPAGLGAWLTGYLADQGSLAAGLQLLLLPPLVGLLCLCVFKVFEQRARTHAIAS
jgi:FSR family fosmidomycin resistance protein-like MFS transporter